MSQIDRLIRFVAVAEERSFSRAARRLNVDQPWLSRQIQQLEGELGLTLLARSTRSVELTPEGAAIYERAREMAHTVDRTLQTARGLGRSSTKQISIGVHHSSYWVPERLSILSRFRTRWPEHMIKVTSAPNDSLIDKIRDCAVDVAFVAGPLAARDDIEMLLVHQHSPRILIPAGDPLARRSSLTLSDFAGRRLVTFDPATDQARWDYFYGPFVAAGAKPVIVSEGGEALYFAARKDRCLLVNFGWAGRDEMLRKEFTVVEDVLGAPPLSYFLIRSRKTPVSIVDKFWRLAIEATRESEAPAQAEAGYRVAS